MTRNVFFRYARFLLLLTAPAIAYTLGCKSLAESETSGVPTATALSGSIDLTTFRDASTRDYHELLKFLQMGGGGSSMDSEEAVEAEGTGVWHASLDEYAKLVLQLLDQRIESKDAFFRSIPPEELVAIYQYTGSLYGPINQYLWNWKKRDQFKFVEGAVKTLAAGLNKLPNFLGVVRRGDSLSPEIIEGKYKAGSVISEKKFLSTSFRAGFGGTVVYTIHSKTGKRVDWISAFPGEAEVLFTPGNYFYVHSIKKNEIVPEGGDDSSEGEGAGLMLSGGGESDEGEHEPIPDGPSFQYVVEMEQIFPDSDTKDCCSEDEMWDEKIRACRYKVDAASGGPIIPYSTPKTLDDFGKANCSMKEIAETKDWTPKAMCADGSCYSGFAKLNLVTDDYLACRKGKRVGPQLDFYDSCSKLPEPDMEGPGMESGDELVPWAAFVYKINYEKNQVEACSISREKVTRTDPTGTRSLAMAAVASAISAEEINKNKFWWTLKGVAGAASDDDFVAQVLPGTSLPEGIFYYMKVDSSLITPVYSKDFDLETEGTKIVERTRTTSLLRKYREYLDRMCAAVK